MNFNINLAKTKTKTKQTKKQKQTKTKTKKQKSHSCHQELLITLPVVTLCRLLSLIIGANWNV